MLAPRGLSIAAVLLGAGLFRTPVAAHADQQALFPIQDNTLIENVAGSSSSGLGPGLFVGKTNSSSLRRTLVRFDVAGAIPAGAHIDSVRLQMTLTRTMDSDPVTVTLHRVEASWGEGTSNGGGGPGGGGGGGAPATTGDATWLHRFFNTQNWATPGGDFAAAASGQATIGGAAASGQVFTWASSAGMVADVQAWLDTPSTNFGWLLKGDESAAGARSTRRFASREFAAEASRPRLLVVYSGVAVRSQTWSRVKALFR